MKKEIITSRQNPLVKTLASLLDKKRRTQTGLFRFDGVKLFYEAVSRGTEIEHIILNSDGAESTVRTVTELLRANPHLEDKVSHVSGGVFEKISEEISPEGIITVAKHIDKLHKTVKIYNGEAEIPLPKEKILAAVAIRDPGNLGTMIRTAAALGMDRLIISSDCADIYSPKTVRAAMGALFSFPIYTVPAEDFVEYLSLLRKSGRRAFAAELDERAADISETELLCGDFFLVGNEAQGLGKEITAACDGSVRIPMKNHCESLNAAAAAAIFIWESAKKRKD